MPSQTDQVRQELLQRIAELDQKYNALMTDKDKENDRPVAVMIDNEIAARPQLGLESAYIVYEIM